jgi:hypothetical protein
MEDYREGRLLILFLLLFLLLEFLGRESETERE